MWRPENPGRQSYATTSGICLILLVLIIQNGLIVVRAFVAIEIPVEMRHQLVEQITRLKQYTPSTTVRWVRLEGIHLTLKFLGDVSLDKLDQITVLLEEVGLRHTPFRIDIGQFGCFPSPRRPRVLWVGVEDSSGVLISLQADLDGVLSQIGFKRETRPFHPHLTLGRVKRGAHNSTVRSLSAILEEVTIGDLGQVNVDEICLIRSDLKPTGALYTRIAMAKLEVIR